MNTFDLKISRWFWTAFRVPMTVLPPTRESCRAHLNAGAVLRRPFRRRRLRLTRCVHLEFVHRQAGSVAIAGTFNDWRPGATPMVPMGAGWWMKGLVLPPGRYEYHFVVDGRPVPDPNAAETVPAPDGQKHSVLVVS